MTVFANDETHLLTSFAFINIAFYLSNALHYWNKNNEAFLCRALWYLNFALLVLTIWNYWWSDTSFFNVTSGWYIFIATLLIVFIVAECIKISIGTITMLIACLIFVAVLIGGRDYVISVFNHQVQPTSYDYVYVGIAVLVLAISLLVYIKLIRGKRYAEVLLNGLTLSWLCSSGIQVLRYQDITCSFCQTTVQVFDYDWVFFTAFALFASFYFFLYWYSERPEKQTDQQQQQDEKLLENQPTNPSPTPSPSPSSPSSSTSDIDTSFSLPINTNIESEQLIASPEGATVPSTTATGGRLGLLKWIRRSRRAT